MFVYLAQTGGTVHLPEAVAVRDCRDPAEIEFLGQNGAVIARFRRMDLLLYSAQELRGLPETDGVHPPDGSSR